ncbi:MAG: serine protease, partial [Pyrinomonadaceae bacterium]|nr:serine protease [Pyrinomonadaceae bacterium]
MDADARFTGRGVTIAFLDSGFYAHPDLTTPHNRILAYHN